MNSDKSFQKINGLKWLPWVGDSYTSTPSKNRLLIVGESHYHDNTLETVTRHESQQFTRKVVQEFAIERLYYGTKIFPNLHKALFRNDQFEAEAFWKLVSFYNFIQRPMATNRERPQYPDYYEAWAIFWEVIALLEPQTCLFIGVTSSNSLMHALENSDFRTTGVKKENRIGRCSQRTATITSNSNHSTNLIFIQHSSKMFSWTKWNEFLKTKISDELSWFEDVIYS